MKPTERVLQQIVIKQPSKGLRVVALWVVILWGISHAKDFLVPLCVAALLAFMMVPLIRFLNRFRIPDPVAILLSILILLAPLPLIGYLAVSQARAMVLAIPRMVTSLTDTLVGLGKTRWGGALHLEKVLNDAKIHTQVSALASDSLHLIMSSAMAILGATTQLVLVLTFTILMLGARAHLRRVGEKLLARSGLPSPTAVLEEGMVLVERFLLARFTIVIIAAVMDSLILWAFGLPYQVLVGAFLGLMTLIPAVGFILGVIPLLIVCVAASAGFLKTFLMALAVWNVANLDNFLLTPKFVGGRLNINALSTFVGIFAGGLLWGVAGMLLSIPLLGVLRIVFSEFPGLECWGELLAEREGPPLADPDAEPEPEFRLARAPRPGRHAPVPPNPAERSDNAGGGLRANRGRRGPRAG